MEQQSPYRITSIDILRGLVMIIMALDHTRDFFHVTAMTDDPMNIATTTVPLYFTRWITHYCAPAFVFLSGVSAYLSSMKKTQAQASLFLFKRGVWLIFIEMVVITFGLTFNPFYNFIIWQVIWAIGCSMVILALLSRLSYKLVMVVGLILFFGHDLFDNIIKVPETGVASYLFKIFVTARGSVLPVDATHFIGIFYAILPWTGAMLMGYSIGPLYTKDFPAVKRKQLLLGSGIVLIVLFVVLRYFNAYGEPAPWDKVHFLSFMGPSKYPPSLVYLCMTLGPLLVALSLLENVKSRFSDVLTIYGRVPFFYYVLHFFLLHILLVIVFYATGHGAADIADPQIPFLFRPRIFGFNLGIVYLIWLSVVAALYLPCKWFNKYKLTHTQWWLKYL